MLFKSIIHFFSAVVPQAIGLVEKELPALEQVAVDFAGASGALAFAYSAKGVNLTGDEAAVTAFIQTYRDLVSVAKGFKLSATPASHAAPQSPLSSVPAQPYVYGTTAEKK